jgi:methionyl-tRNA synthetase
VIGKGIVRFHAVYWPAILLSAGQPLPTTIVVHDYLTVDGLKLSKSLGTAIDPVAVIDRYGVDALRWWFLRDVPRAGDADFRADLIAARANALADGLGNLVNRTIALVRRLGAVRGEAFPEAAPLLAACAELPSSIDEALGAFDFRAATGALWDVVAHANRFVSATRPWELAKGERLDAVLGAQLEACTCLAHELRPFLPAAAGRIDAALDALDPQRGRTLFPKLSPSAGTAPARSPAAGSATSPRRSGTASRRASASRPGTP